MANASILAAFERMWNHVVLALNNKADSDHTQDWETIENRPFGEVPGTDTVYWDGNREGLVKAEGYDRYMVSTAVPTLADFENGASNTKLLSGTESTSNLGMGTAIYEAGDGCIVVGNTIVALKDGASLGDEVYPKKGTYFAWIGNDSYTVSLTINGYTGFLVTKKIDPKYLPDDIGATPPVDSVNGKTGAVTLSASDVGAVPTSCTINNKALSSNVILSASDVGAAASSHSHTTANITDFGTKVYDATASRTANTVLAAPNGSAGKASFRKLVSADLLEAYPVNSIYIGYSHTSPASLFGGTWHRMESRFLWGTPSTGTIGATAGEMTHTLTEDEMPNHIHNGLYYDGNSEWISLNSGTSGYKLTWSANAGKGWQEIDTGPTGGGAAHNNMPPYVNVAIWRRTA